METWCWERAWGLDKVADAGLHAKGPTLGTPFPAENSWAGNTRGDRPSILHSGSASASAVQQTLPGCHHSLLTPGTWEFPNSKRERK